MKSDTPRTDAVCSDPIQYDHGGLDDLSRELERGLNHWKTCFDEALKSHVAHASQLEKERDLWKEDCRQMHQNRDYWRGRYETLCSQVKAALDSPYELPTEGTAYHVGKDEAS